MMVSRPDSVALSVFPLLIFGTMVCTGNVTTGPRLIDENQIYELQLEFHERGFLRTFMAHQQDRIRMKRLFPTFAAQKVVQAWMLGGNFTAWKLWTGILNAWTAMLLYAFLRLCRFDVLEATLFSLITVLGEQSIVWWRPIQGEGIGMFFLAAALVCMAIRARTGRLRYEIAFSLFATLSMLSKESFILALPAILLLKVAISYAQSGSGLSQAIKQSRVSMAWLSIVFVTAVATVRIIFGTSTFNYAGWTGFDTDKFLNVVMQYIEITNGWVLVPLVGIAAWCFYPFAREGRIKGRADVRTDGTRHGRQHATRMLLAAVLFWAVLTVPQLMLYMKTGMVNVNAAYASRYIFPCILGFALLIAALLRYIRTMGGRRGLALPIAAAIVVISLAEKGGTALDEGRVYAERSRLNDKRFETISAHTGAQDRVVLVYLNVADGSYSLQVALRVYYILSQRHHRPQMLLHPLPPRPTIEESLRATIRADTRHHGRKMRTIAPADNRRNIDAVLILNWRTVPNWDGPTSILLERALVHEDPVWFDPRGYQRVHHELGHISYFRQRAPE